MMRERNAQIWEKKGTSWTTTMGRERGGEAFKNVRLEGEKEESSVLVTEALKIGENGAEDFLLLSPS